MSKILTLFCVLAVALAAEKRSKDKSIFDNDSYCIAHCDIGDHTENGHTFCVPLKSVVDACEFHRKSDDSGFD